MEGKSRGVDPFFYSGNSTGLLLVHGFTGSPSEMRFLGERLATEGWTVLGVRLSGHGSTPEELSKTRWEDWAKDAEEGVKQLRRTCDRVIGIGLSMGGLIVLHLAAQGLLDGMIEMNAPMVLQNWGARLAHLYKPFIQYVNKPKSHGHESPRANLEAPVERFMYDRVPVVCLDSLNRAIRQVRREVGKIQVPALLMQSEKDKTVDPISVIKIQERMKLVQPEVLHFKKSGHILTLGPEREEVAVRAAQFIRRFEPRGKEPRTYC